MFQIELIQIDPITLTITLVNTVAIIGIIVLTYKFLKKYKKKNMIDDNDKSNIYDNDKSNIYDNDKSNIYDNDKSNIE